MYESVKLLNKEDDKKLKIKPIKGFKYSSELQTAPISIKEFYEACKSQPIVFTKSQDDEYGAFALLGLKQNSNNFVAKNGDWVKGQYVPAFVRRYPFIFTKIEDKLALALDEKSDALNQKTGEALFDEQGEATDYLNNVMKFMETYQEELLRTQALAKVLDELELLEPAQVNGKLNGEDFALTGFMRVSEEKFNALDDAKVLELTKSGLYKLITAHLISMSNFTRMANLA